jgi:hypothetical protein
MTHSLTRSLISSNPGSDHPSRTGRDGTRLLTAILIALCTALLAAKVGLVTRLNINWDEFHFLSDVHELTRGELTLTFQTAYTHVFRWLTLLNVDEVGQVMAGRMSMIAALTGTCLLLWRLAAVWVPAPTALLAPLTYLCMLPIAKHGAAFRYDPLLATLTVAILLLIARPGTRFVKIITAGMLAGVAAALTPKAVLLAPSVVALIVLNCPRNAWQEALKQVFWLTVIGAVTSAVLLTIHSLWVAPAEATIDFAARSVRTTLLETPLFPQLGTLLETLWADRVAWVLIALGSVAAIWRLRYRPAFACLLALLPVIFYRNSFAYYYPVMLAPACVLSAVAVATIQSLVAGRARKAAETWLPLTVAAVLGLQGTLHLISLRHDETQAQRAVVSAVHMIFPAPVAYIDHSGMIGTFDKANFFMSSWGVERYRTAGKSFMAEALALHRPPLLIANTPILEPNHQLSNLLLPEDRELIRKFYIPYWGPVRVAGAEVEVHPDHSSDVHLPLVGQYRIESSEPILINGTTREILEVFDTGEAIQVALQSGARNPTRVRLIWAEAQAAPSAPPPTGQLYSRL